MNELPPAPECQKPVDSANIAEQHQDISDDARTLNQVRAAILKLRNERADGETAFHLHVTPQMYSQPRQLRVTFLGSLSYF